METLFYFLDYIKINVEYNFYSTFLLFFIILLIYNTFAIPGGLIFNCATGYFFGIFFGFLIVIFTLVCGSFIFFSFSKFFIKNLFPKTIRKYSLNLNNYISNSTLEYLIIFRMVPGLPLFIQNLLLSLLKVSRVNFIIASFIGFSPIVFISVFIGSQFADIEKIKNVSLNDIISYKFLIFILCIIIFLLIRIFNKKN